MTDKQIIIDGVDVSGCEFYCRYTDNCLDYKRWYNKPLCKHLPDCHYKQLKRKEQECEGLKIQIKKHNDDMFKNPPEKRFYCKGCTLPYISKKLKATLTEIKTDILDIKEGISYFWVIDKCDEILQKISECEV